jgi:hypothetical protein
MPPALFADLGKTPKGEANLVQDHHEKKKKKGKEKKSFFLLSPCFLFFVLSLLLLSRSRSFAHVRFPFRCLSFSTDKRKKKKMPRQKINFFFLFFPLLLQTCSPRTSRRIWK